MDYIGIDIGSTAAKVAVIGDHQLFMTLPTGWSSVETAEAINKQLAAQGIDTLKAAVVATGYGRGAVAYGDKQVTEIMANRLECTIDELFALAEQGEVLSISSLCTVFAESEVINHIGAGKKRQDIAAGVVDSVASKVAGLAGRMPLPQTILLTGGLSHLPFFAQSIGNKLGHEVLPQENGRFAGAYGAALLARKMNK